MILRDDLHCAGKEGNVIEDIDAVTVPPYIRKGIKND